MLEPVIERFVACAVMAAALLASEARAQPGEQLFIVARNKNANIVSYDVRRRPTGELELAAPLDAYWIMRAEDGHREPLTWIERQAAYGFSVSHVSLKGFTLRLQAFKQREIHVEWTARGYRAYLTIAGKKTALNRIFVMAAEGGLLPTVRYVELQGVNELGAPVAERINVN